MKKRFLPLFILLLLGGLAYFSFSQELSWEHFKEYRSSLQAWVNTHPILAPAVFCLFYISIVAISFPAAAPASLLIGAFFGTTMGIIYVAFSATIGASVIYLAVKTAFIKAEQKAKIDNHSVSYLLFVRLIPIFPFFVVNMTLAFFPIRLWTYVWTTFFGILPGTYVFVQAGSVLAQAVDVDFSISAIMTPEIKIAFVAMACLALFPILIKRVYQSRKHA